MFKKKAPVGRPGQNPANSFEIVEAYRTLRTNLLFALASAPRKIIVVSSPEPNAGKSITSSHLATMMAQTSERVLLIDADLRKPTQHRIFKTAGSEGLTGHLLNRGNWQDYVCKEVAPQLDLMTAGLTPSNPSELLGSARMKHFLEQVSAAYEYVFIDTSPINVVTDALMLSAYAAGTVLVARQDQTTYDELNEAIESVRRVNGKLLGVILNDYAPPDGRSQSHHQYPYMSDK